MYSFLCCCEIVVALLVLILLLFCCFLLLSVLLTQIIKNSLKLHKKCLFFLLFVFHFVVCFVFLANFYTNFHYSSFVVTNSRALLTNRLTVAAAPLTVAGLLTFAAAV